MAVSIIPTLVLTLLLGGFMVSQRKQDLEDGLRQRGLLLARQMAAASDYGVFSGNQGALQAIVDAVGKEVAVNSAVVSNSEGIVLAATGARTDLALLLPAAVRGGVFADPSGHFLIIAEEIRSPDVVGDELSNEVSRAIDASDIVTSGRQGLAIVELNTREVEVETRRFAILVIELLSLVLAITVWVARKMSHRVSRPIIAVAAAVEKIGQGGLGIRVQPSRIGVLDLLATGVNEMAQRLELAIQNLEDKVSEATSQLLVKKEEAEQASQAKTRFLAAASHDLRQPMHAIGMFVAALSQPRPEAERQQLIEQTGRAVTAMGDLLDSLLDISRLDAGGVQAKLSVFCLQLAFERVANDFADLAAAKNIELVVRHTPYFVVSDRILVERILMNLVSNAVRYTNEGRILICARVRSGQVVCEVRDSGVGVPEESLAKIFQEFVQLDNPERDRSKGLGLGLAIVQRLVNLLHHRLEVRSRLGCGSVFSLFLPMSPIPLAQAAEESVLPQDGGEASGLNVIVIDDDQMIRHSLQALLSGWGCRVLLHNGDSPLLGSQMEFDPIPDILICDYRLGGGINGADLIRDIRRTIGYRVPAVIVTGESELQDVASEADGDPIIQKPVKPAQLKALLRNVAREKHLSTGKYVEYS